MARIGIDSTAIVTVYCSIVRPILEYASPVWHCGLTQGQAAELENVQKRCLKMIFPDLSYADALGIAGIERLSVRRERAVISLFKEIKHSSHILNNLLPLNRMVLFGAMIIRIAYLLLRRVDVLAHLYHIVLQDGLNL